MCFPMAVHSRPNISDPGRRKEIKFNDTSFNGNTIYLYKKKLMATLLKKKEEEKKNKVKYVKEHLFFFWSHVVSFLSSKIIPME